MTIKNIKLAALLVAVLFVSARAGEIPTIPIVSPTQSTSGGEIPTIPVAPPSTDGMTAEPSTLNWLLALLFGGE